MGIRRTLIAAATAVIATTASASSYADGLLRPIQGQSIELGTVSGTAYYTVERDGYRVVATFAQRGEDATPVRVETLLAPGQSVTLSTPRGPGEAAEAVEITREADALLVRRVSVAVTN